MITLNFTGKCYFFIFHCPEGKTGLFVSLGRALYSRSTDMFGYLPSLFSNLKISPLLVTALYSLLQKITKSSHDEKNLLWKPNKFEDKQNSIEIFLKYTKLQKGFKCSIEPNLPQLTL